MNILFFYFHVFLFIEFDNVVSPSVSYKYTKSGTYTVRAAIRTIHGRYFELEPQTIEVIADESSSESSGAVRETLSKLALLMFMMTMLFF